MTEAMPKTELYSAILAVQAEAPAIQKSKLNPAFRSKYVSLDALHEVVVPLINKHGLVWVTRPQSGAVGDRNGDGHISGPCLRYSLVHAESGQSLEGTMPLMLAKNDPQGQGSAITYARRYALMAVLGLVADEDDDGNSASSRSKSSSRSRSTTRASTRTSPPDGPSEPVDAPDGDGDTPRPVSTETLEKIAVAARRVGLTPAQWKPIVKEAGAEGKKSHELTEDEGRWVLIKLGSMDAKS